MDYVLDLLTTLSKEDPGSVVKTFLQAAEKGAERVVQRILDNHLDLVRPVLADQDLRMSMLRMASRLHEEPRRTRALRAFAQWLSLVAEHPDVNMVEMAREALALGPLSGQGTLAALLDKGLSSLSVHDASERELVGCRAGLLARQVTLLGEAIIAGSPLAPDLLKRCASRFEPFPVVAEVKVRDQYVPVAAPALALLCGDLHGLDKVLGTVRKEDVVAQSAATAALQLALDPALTDGSTSELAHGLGVLIARGAPLLRGGDESPLLATRFNLAPESTDFDPAVSYSLPALLLGMKTEAVAAKALSRLIREVGLSPNAAVSPVGGKGTMLHYAAAGGRGQLVAALLAAGADAKLRDERGATAADWAAAFGHQEVAAQLGATPAPARIDVEEPTDFVHPLSQAVTAEPPSWVDEVPSEGPSAAVVPTSRANRPLGAAATSKGAALFARLREGQLRLAQSAAPSPR